jgi:outer membrane autotransporter protein
VGRWSRFQTMKTSMSRLLRLAPLALLAVSAAPRPLLAQIVADGIPVTANGTIDTGTTPGPAGTGVRALNGGTIEGQFAVTTGGTEAGGAEALTGGQINLLAGSSIKTSGSDAEGLDADGAGSKITATGTTIVTSGGGSHGALAVGGGTVVLNGGSITTSGSTAVGLFSEGAGSTITATGVTVTTSGSGSGAQASLGGAIAISGSSLTTTGSPANGILLLGGGSVTVTGSTVETLGAGSKVLVAASGVNSATIEGSSLTSAQGAGLSATLLGTLNATVTGSSITAPTVLETSIGGKLNLTADASTLTGAASTGAGTTSTVTLQNGTLWTMTGSSTLTNLTNAASTINFTPPVADPTQFSSYKTLTVTNYVGGGGTLGLNTFLGNDSSPSDRLVISGGTATGSSLLRISNTAGLGDLTTGSGILVVDAINGATTDDAFRLAGPVIAGPYEYLLFKGDGNPEAWYLRSTLDCSLPGAPDELCAPSTPIRTLPAPAPPCPLPPPVGPPPVAPVVPPAPGTPQAPGAPPVATPTAPASPGPQVPNFRQEVSLYAAIPNLALLYGRTAIGTLHDRVGDELSLNRPPPPLATSAVTYGQAGAAPPMAAYGPYGYAGPEAAGGTGYGAWGRVIAEQGDRDGGCPVLIGPSFDYSFGAVQAGFDAIRWQHTDGSRDRAGVFGTLGDAHADVDGRIATTGLTGNVGRDSFAAYSLGAYWTHTGALGWYLDGVVQGTFYDVRGQSTRIPALETDGWGFAASIEAGYPLRGLLGGWGLGGLSIEPQAQLIYQSIDLGDTRDIGAQVRFDDVESLAGRVGVRFATSWAMPALFGLHPPLTTTAWVRPSYWHEFSSDPKTLFSSQIGFLPFRANVGVNWGEIATGLTVQVDRNTALFASASYTTDLEGDGEAWDGKLGLKVAW